MHEVICSSAFEQMTSQLRAARQDAADAQRAARDLARDAGKAEIATGVLHNIGNALNGLTVASGLLHQTLSTTRAPRLQDTAGRVRQRDVELEGRLAADAAGGKLLAYLDALAGRWVEEIAQVRTRASEIQSSVEHMRAVVAKQQIHARTVACAESSSANDVVEQASALLGDSLVRRGIELHVEHRDAADVDIDRHRAVQILTNLLANARDALSDVRGRRRVNVVSCIDLGKMSISVTDNGRGIASELRSKLFQYGFTTKPDGHGFGLHNGALLAGEIGGSLRFEPGEEGGSRFILTLPVTPSAAGAH